MDIEKIKTVLSVAKFRSFSDTAFEISLSQSAVSKHIASIETELGVQIFSRTRAEKSVQLTREGEIFLKYANDIVASYNKLCRALDDLHGARRCPFIVSTIPVPSCSSFSRSVLISSFYIRYPEIDLKIVNYSQSKLKEAILTGKIDAAIVRILIENDTVLPPESLLFDARLAIDDICENPCLVAISERHPLANKGALELFDLKDEDIFLQRPELAPGEDKSSPSRYNMFLRSCMDAGFEPNIVSTLDPSSYQGEVALNLVRRGQGVMVIHVRMQSHIPGIKQIPLHGLNWSARTIVVSPKESKRAPIEKLISVLNDLMVQ